VRGWRANLDRWISAAPRIECDWDALKNTYRRSLVDLAALRFSPPIAGGRSLPAAGLPWFMTMFGRDSIFTSLQALPFTPELAATTLRALGDWQGVRLDDFRDEDPGRILHEMRYGEMTAFEERPHSPYYGSVDATPLYVILLDEYELWTGDRAIVRELEIEARAALAWIDEYADLRGQRLCLVPAPQRGDGLEKQCWKDSWDSISYRDGRLPGFPPATCELQGLRVRTRGAAAPARALTSGKTPSSPRSWNARQPTSSAAQPRLLGRGRRDNFALALGPRGQPGRRPRLEQRDLLWSGIVDKSKADGRRPPPGWGPGSLRLGRADRGRRRVCVTNPIGYHVGTVWPFDNSFIAWGLRRYGFKDEAARSRRDPRRGRVLRRAPARGVRRLRALADEVPGPVPDGLQPAGLVDGRAAPAAAHDARARADRRPPRRRPALPQEIGHLELLDIPGRWGGSTPSAAAAST
jgi:hypothetical protein